MMRVVLLLMACLSLTACELWYGGSYREPPRRPAPPAEPAPAPTAQADTEYEPVSEPEPRRPAEARPRARPEPKYKIPLHPELQGSVRLLNRTTEHPTVRENFMSELDRARSLLDQAIAIWIEEKGKLDEDDEEWQEIRHLNYLAHQRIAIAVMKARGVDAREALAKLQNRKTNVRKPAPKLAPAKPAAAAPQFLAVPGLPSSLQALRPRHHARGLVLTLDERHFLPGQARLVDGEALFDTLMDYLIANPGKNVACEGHSGDRDDNLSGQQLSQQRARAVQQALLERGLEFSRVTAVGYGGTQPLVSNGMVLGRKARVEIVISDTAPAGYGTRTP